MLSPELTTQLAVMLQSLRADLMEHVRTHGSAPEGEAPDIGPAAHMVEADDAPERLRSCDEDRSAGLLKAAPQAHECRRGPQHGAHPEAPRREQGQSFVDGNDAGTKCRGEKSVGGGRTPGG